MKQLLSLMLIILSGWEEFFCQNRGALNDRAECLFRNKDYANALPCYLKLRSVDSTNISINLRIGACYLHSRSQKNNAHYFLERAIIGMEEPYNSWQAEHVRESVSAYEMLAECYQLSGNYYDACEEYAKLKRFYLSIPGDNQVELDAVNWKIGMCRKVHDLHPAASVLIDKGKVAGASQDGFYCGSLIPDYSKTGFLRAELERQFSGQPQPVYFSDFRIGYREDTLYPARGYTDSVNDPLGEEATIATSLHGQIILTYKDEDGSAGLYTSKLIGNHWTKKRKLNIPENPEGWEPHESISADGSMLYFAADRPEGYGGMDIYKCRRLPSGEWGMAENLGPFINSPYDEEAPFIYSGGATLYFSSNRYTSKSKFQLFSSDSLSEGRWLTPIHIGYPTNKMADSMSYNQPGGAENNEEIMLSEPSSCRILFKDQKMTCLTVMEGFVEGNECSKPPNLRITVTDNETGKISNSYFPDSKKGFYSIFISSGRNNNVTFDADGYLFHSENIDQKTDTSHYVPFVKIRMTRMEPGSSMLLNNIFFDSAEVSLLATSRTEFSRLLDLFEMHPSLIAEITFSGDSKDANRKEKNLAVRRAISIKEYLVYEGIHPDRIIVNTTKKQVRRLARRNKKSREDAKAEKTSAPGFRFTIVNL